ncbi:MAG: hypothetical protein IT373_11720 [Polyangiaceae bacterium]|nr:hypothetical protein [Polyangiaceae bacterium]
MRHLPAIVLTGLLATALASAAACGKPASAPGEQLDSECAGRADQARKRVLAAVEANLACRSDDDCQVVAVGSGCFDACTRAVNAEGVAAVAAARAAVDEADCRSFRSDGCRLEHPPCAPPAAAACREGRCE